MYFLGGIFTLQKRERGDTGSALHSHNSVLHGSWSLRKSLKLCQVSKSRGPQSGDASYGESRAYLAGEERFSQEKDRGEIRSLC